MPGELILVVDDEANIVELAKLYLEREGFSVAAVGNGQSALDHVDKDHPAAQRTHPQALEQGYGVSSALRC